MALEDRELDAFIGEKIMHEAGVPYFTANIGETWRVVEKMIREHHCELKLDVFLGVTGQHWVASFYSPRQCRRYEAQGPTAPLAICRAAREAFRQREG